MHSSVVEAIILLMHNFWHLLINTVQCNVHRAALLPLFPPRGLLVIEVIKHGGNLSFLLISHLQDFNFGEKTLTFKHQFFALKKSLCHSKGHHFSILIHNHDSCVPWISSFQQAMFNYLGDDKRIVCKWKSGKTCMLLKDGGHSRPSTGLVSLK